MWKKKSIFWELPYCQVLEVRSAIDVMHPTKNLCVNPLGFIGVYGNLIRMYIWTYISSVEFVYEKLIETKKN